MYQYLRFFEFILLLVLLLREFFKKIERIWLTFSDHKPAGVKLGVFTYLTEMHEELRLVSIENKLIFVQKLQSLHKHDFLQCSLHTKRKQKSHFCEYFVAFDT